MREPNRIQKSKSATKDDKLTVCGEGVDGFCALLMLEHVVDCPLKQASISLIVIDNEELKRPKSHPVLIA
jgi:hypothetical protein